VELLFYNPAERVGILSAAYKFPLGQPKLHLLPNLIFLGVNLSKCKVLTAEIISMR
jgi:hypothetical protein